MNFKANWSPAFLLSVLLNVALIMLVMYKPVERLPNATVVQPPPFALYLGKLQSPANAAAANEAPPKVKPKPPIEPKKKPLPKLEVAKKAKIVVEKKVEVKPTPEPVKTPPPVEPEPEKVEEKTTENTTNDGQGVSGKDNASSQYGFGGPRGDVASSPVQGTGATLGKAGLASWKDLVFMHLNKYKSYPSQAKRLANPTGIVRLKMVVDAQGNVLDAEVIKSSRNIYLDRAAKQLTQQASPVPAPTAEFIGNKSRITVIVPVDYNFK